MPIGGLLAVLAGDDVTKIDAFIAKFQAEFIPR